MGKDLQQIPTRPGRVRCLRCCKYFDSWDRCRNRICPECNKENLRDAGIRVVAVAHWSAAVVSTYEVEP